MDRPSAEIDIDNLLLGTVEIFSRDNRWATHAERNTQLLGEFLRDIVDQVEFERYNDGYPRPAESINALRRIASMARRADQTGQTDKLSKRLAAYRKEDHDLVQLLLWQVAVQRDPASPSKAVLELEADTELEYLARQSPGQLATFAATIIDQLEPQKQSGKGGARRRPAHEKRFVVEQLGLHYDIVTGEVPGTSFDPTLPARDQHAGPFLEACAHVLDALGMPTTTSQAYELLRSIDNDYWARMRAERRFGSTES